MPKKFVTYFIPLFLAIYFVVAFLPVFATGGGEIFPFFSFKLYSKIPNGFSRYDLLLNQGDEDESFLVFKNAALNNLEMRNYASRLSSAGKLPEESLTAFLEDNADLLEKGRTIHFVEITGNTINAVRDGEYNVDIIKKLK